ncbi:sialate O-acetylesterase [Flavobacteriaceae bacterium GSB9]|nr:sialate O-acetylesterase [Flavobacteriaceae bacterium GSB9]
MVLQQKVKIPVWGTGRNGENVKVEFNGKTVTTVVEKNHWHIVLPEMDAGGPHVMKITGNNSVVIKDIYIGEVWVCSGQSNMERKMSPHWKYQTISNYEKEKKAANYPLIRQYNVPHKKSNIPLENTKGEWTVCSPETIESFSAVGYFFSRDLFEAKKVPIGIILSTVGGTQAKYWISQSSLSNKPELEALVKAYDESIKKFTKKLAAYNSRKKALLVQYEHGKKKAKKKGKTQPLNPKPPQDPTKRRFISCYFNGMIAPLLKYPIAGVAWYQGESDRDFAKQYQILFPTLISDWRKHWKTDNLPFLFVQIAPFKENNPEIREAQLLTLQNTENTAMIVTIDCGDATDIHPPLKQPIGYRLSLAARALAYHENIAYSGPIIDDYSIKNDKIEISFKHIYGGLKHKGKTLTGFTIADSSENFVPAKAEIKGNKIIVYNKNITNPVAVRYGWANIPKGNLYNAANLPASPFRTDIDN